METIGWKNWETKVVKNFNPFQVKLSITLWLGWQEPCSMVGHIVRGYILIPSILAPSGIELHGGLTGPLAGTAHQKNSQVGFNWKSPQPHLTRPNSLILKVQPIPLWSPGSIPGCLQHEYFDWYSAFENIWITKRHLKVNKWGEISKRKPKISWKKMAQWLEA